MARTCRRFAIGNGEQPTEDNRRTWERRAQQVRLCHSVRSCQFPGILLAGRHIRTNPNGRSPGFSGGYLLNRRKIPHLIRVEICRRDVQWQAGCRAEEIAVAGDTPGYKHLPEPPCRLLPQSHSFSRKSRRLCRKCQLRRPPSVLPSLDTSSTTRVPYSG